MGKCLSKFKLLTDYMVYNNYADALTHNCTRSTDYMAVVVTSCVIQVEEPPGDWIKTPNRR